MSTVRRTDRPQNPAVLLDEARAYLRIETDAEDALIAALIDSAQVTLEDFLNRSLTDRSWELVLDRWPAGAVRLPRPPLRRVDSVTVIAMDGTEQAVADSAYQVDTRPEPGLLIPESPGSLPAPGRREAGIVIGFTAGFGPGWNDVPAPLRQAVLMMVARLFEHRDPGAQTALPEAVRRITAPFRMMSL